MRSKKLMLVWALALSLAASAQGQLFIEDFTNLTVGNLGTQNSWVPNGTGTDVQINDANPITYNGYSSGGNEYSTIATLNGLDPHHTFTGQSTATPFTIWYAFIIKVASAPSTTGDYFLSLRNTANTTYGGRIFAKQGSAVGKVSFGISKGGAAADNYSADFDTGTTYLVVAKYMSKSGTANDSMYLWVNPSLSSEPNIGSATVSHNSASADPGWGTTVNAIMIHQRSTASIAASLDGIRVGNNWTDIAPSASGGSDVSAGSGAEPAVISALVDSDAEKVLNFDFRVKDDSTGSDALNTLIDKIVITKGAGNDLTNWAAVIDGAKLFDGSADSTAGAVYADSIVFSGIDHSSGKLGEVVDDGSKTYQLKIWLKSDLGFLKTTIDNSNLAFKVDRSSFVVDVSGTPFASGAGTAVESGSSNNAISVSASSLGIAAEPPASVDVGVDFGLTVAAIDSNGNRDLDAGHGVTLALLGGTGNLTSASGLTQNLSSGVRTWGDLQYDLAESGLRIEASASGLAPDTTISFSVISGAPTVQASDIVFSQVSENQMVISWTNGNGSARIVLVQEGSPVDADPVDGSGYFASSTYGMGQQIGDGNYTVYNGSGSCDTILGLAPNTTYHFAVYEYNGSGGTENYLTLNPAVASQTTTENFDPGDYRSLKTGNWTDLSTWEAYDGTLWSAPSQPPCSTNNIIIRSSDTVAVNTAASCRNIMFYGANYGTRLDIGDQTLAVHGTLNADGVTLNDYLIRCNGGRLKFVGGGRPLFGDNWGAYGTRWRMEVALNPGDTGTSSKNVKAAEIIISSGIFRGGDVRPDSGLTSTGSIYVAAGSSLIARNISRTSTATAKCRRIYAAGTIELYGYSIAADSILFSDGSVFRSCYYLGQGVTGVLQYSPGAILEYAGSTAQHTKQELLLVMPHVRVNNPSGVTMDTSVTIASSLTMATGMLYTNIDSLMLGPSAAVIGEQSGRYVAGKLLTARPVGTGSSDLGGIGVILGSGADDLGTVAVRRISGPAGVVVASVTNPQADTGIARRWDIVSDNPPTSGRTLTLSWVSDDDNGRDLSSAYLWKSLDGGANWTAVFGPFDASSSRSITQNVNSFSSWTVSDGANPLPVQLASITGAIEGGLPVLQWITSWESAAASWRIERSSLRDGGYQLIGEIPAQGQPHTYRWTDRTGNPEINQYYRLGQRDADGTINYYGPLLIGAHPGAEHISRLLACGPSPFRGTAVISYQVGQEGSPVSLDVFNIVGQPVCQRDLGVKRAGVHQAIWDGRDGQGRRLSAGVYFVSLNIGSQRFIRRLTMLR